MTNSEGTAYSFPEGMTPAQKSAMTHVPMVCESCRFAWNVETGIIAFDIAGSLSDNKDASITVRQDCPICRMPVVREVPVWSAARNENSMVATLTKEGLIFALTRLRASIEADTVADVEAVEAVQRVPWLRRAGGWLRQHNADIALVLTLLSLTLDAVQAMTPQEPYFTPDQVEQIISGVIQKLDDGDDAP